MSKIIQAVFSSGKFATTTDVFQWDKGDILQIEGLDLPESYEVHFSNSLNTPALVVSASGNTVETPAEVFENSGREVYAWIVVLESANVYHTIGQVRIPINPRGMPADLIPTPGYIPDRSKSAIKEAVDQWLAEHRPEFNDGVPYAVKDALITLFEHVAYTDDQGETYLNNLKRAFALVKSLVSIEAVLDTGGAEITDSDTLGTLRQYLTVTVTYDDGSTATVTDYTLAGTLEVGTSTIVVTYGTASDTVEVTVTGTKTLVSIGAVFDDSHTVYDTDTLEDLRQYLTVTAYYDDSSSREVINYTLSGELTEGTSTITVSYGGKTDTFSVTVKYLPSGYIRDGLVFFLDGKHVASVNQWTDLVGSKTFELTNCTLDTNGGVVFDGTAYGTYQGQVTNDWENETIEVVFDGIDSIKTKTILYQPTVNATTGISLRFGDEGTKVRFCNCPDGTTRAFPTANVSTSKNRASLTADTLVLNQTKSTTTDRTSYSMNQTGSTYLGAQRFTETGIIGGKYIGKILAIRIYNRKLTQAEMVSNQQNDVSYYGL